MCKKRNYWNGSKDIYYSSRTAILAISSLALTAILIIASFAPLVNSPGLEAIYRTVFLVLGAVVGSMLGSYIDDKQDQPAVDEASPAISLLGKLTAGGLIIIFAIYGVVLTANEAATIPLSTWIAAILVAILPILTSLLLDPHPKTSQDVLKKYNQ